MQSKIENLKKLIKNPEVEPLQDCCSETDTDGDDSPPKSNVSKVHGNDESTFDDTPLVSLVPKSKGTKNRTTTKSLEASATSMSSQTVSRKRGRLVLSDDEDDENKQQHVAGSTSNECESHYLLSGCKMGWDNLPFILSNIKVLHMNVELCHHKII